MPRSFAERLEEKTSLSRGSFGKGSLGRYSSNGGGTGNLNDAISIGSAATRHWVNSVSDIYGPDEIEELLDDLNRLELAGAAYSQSEDEVEVYDYQGLNRGLNSESTMSAGIFGKEGNTGDRKIISSTEPGVQVDQVDLLGKDTEMREIGGDGTTAAGGVESGGGYCMPVQTSRGSPTFSVKSWDSHTHYQEFKEPEEDDPDIFPSRPMQSIVCYCDISTFKTPRTLLRVLLVVTSIACLSTVLTAGTAKMGLFALPQFPKLRIMIFVTVFTVVFTVFIIFLNISHLHALLPFEYGKMQTIVYLLLTVAYAVASTLVFQAHSEYNSTMPKSTLNAWTANQLLVTTLLGYTCMVETFLCIFNCGRSPVPPPPSASKSTDIHQPYDKMVQESSTHFTLHETTSTRAVTTESIQRQLPPPSAPPAPSEQLKSENQSRKRQFLVNENYESGGGSSNAPPVKGGQSSSPPPLNNANAPSSNAKHNQSKISKSTSNPAQTLPSEGSNPQQQHRSTVEHGNRGNMTGHRYDEHPSSVQNPQQKISNSSRNQPYPSSSSRNAELSNIATRDSIITDNPTKHRHHHPHNRNQNPNLEESNPENSVSKAHSNPAKDTFGNQDEIDGTEGAAYWSASTGKADLIVHDSTTRSKSDKSSRRHDSNVHTKKDPSYESSSNPHHKHKDHHHSSSKNKSGGGVKSYYDNPSSNKNTSSVGNNNYNTTSANASDSKYYSTGVNNNVPGDNCNSDQRHRSKTTTHAMVEPSKRSSKKISSAMVPQHYYLSNTPEIPPPLPSCPPPPLDTPPPTTSNLQNETRFSYNPYYPSSSTYKSSTTTSHNYQSHPSSLDNRNKLNHSVHGDNNTTVSSRSGGQNKKHQNNEKIIISPPLSNKHLSNTKHVGAGSSSKFNQEAAADLSSSTLVNKELEENNKKSTISTTAVISSGSTSSSPLTNLQLESLNQISIDKQIVPNKSTGAIPKKKRTQESFNPSATSSAAASSTKPSTTSSKSVTSSTNQNHLDEIVSFPLDDTISSPSVGLNTSLSNRTNLPHTLITKDSTNPSDSSLPSYGGSSNKNNIKNSQRHYVQ